jgi:hypothetical protein
VDWWIEGVFEELKMENSKLERLTRIKNLRNQAYEEAAALLENGASDMDLDETQSQEDESYVREYIRVEIVKLLRKRVV